MVPNRATHHKYDFDDRLPEEESMNLIFLNQVKNFLHANISWKKEGKKICLLIISCTILRTKTFF